MRDFALLNPASYRPGVLSDYDLRKRGMKETPNKSAVPELLKKGRGHAKKRADNASGIWIFLRRVPVFII